MTPPDSASAGRGEAVNYNAPQGSDDRNALSGQQQSAPSSPPAGEEQLLNKLWDAGYQCHKAVLVKGNVIDEREFRAKAVADAKAALQAYILAEVLDIVNTGQFIAPNLTAKENVQSYQDFIVEKAIARFGKGGNRG